MTVEKSVPRILVVDDDETVRNFVKRVLCAGGYEVMIASGGAEALELVQQQPRFDEFVIDLSMPKMRGDELARRLRQADPDVKVLYFTGYSDELFKQRPALWQDEAFVDKPVTVQGLLEAVSLLLFGHTNGPGVSAE